MTTLAKNFIQASSFRQVDDNNVNNCDDLFLHSVITTFFEAITIIYDCQLKLSEKKALVKLKSSQGFFNSDC